MSAFLKYSTMSITFVSRCFSNLPQSCLEPATKKKKKCCLFLKFIVQGKGINRCTVRVEMLSLFNGMHRADIMSEIVSGRKPVLSAPHIALEMKWQMDSCPRSCDSSGCLTDLFGLSCASLLRCYKLKCFHSFRVKISVLEKKKALLCRVSWGIYVVNLVSRPQWFVLAIYLIFIRSIWDFSLYSHTSQVTF